VQRLDETFRCRIGAQTMPPRTETAPLLPWALPTSGRIRMPKVDGREARTRPVGLVLMAPPRDLAMSLPEHCAARGGISGFADDRRNPAFRTSRFARTCRIQPEFSGGPRDRRNPVREAGAQFSPGTPRRSRPSGAFRPPLSSRARASSSNSAKCAPGPVRSGRPRPRACRTAGNPSRP